MQAIQDIQAAQITQVDIQETIVPVMPTEESQADKGIDHPLWSCWDCDTVWRSYERTRCPGCARHVGHRSFLDEAQESELFQAVYGLPETNCSYTEEQLEHSMWRFRNLLCECAPWYDMNSRLMIQACYETLCERGGTSLKDLLAIHFFKEEYAFAPEEDNTFCPEVIEYTEDAQYDLQHPSW